MRRRHGFMAGIALLVLSLLVAATPALAKSQGEVNMYRLYNPYSGEHLYTASATERDDLTGRGWNDEGIGWVAPQKSDTPVYRLYNPYTSDHHYTTSLSEYNACGAQGWNQEGIGWYSSDQDDATRVPLYREFNPYATIGTHNYTTSTDEDGSLVASGWRKEGVAWYGVRAGTPAPQKAATRSTQQTSKPAPKASRQKTQREGVSSTVYIASSGKGKRYHSNPNCRGLSNARGVTSISLGDAQARGFTPCRLCY